MKKIIFTVLCCLLFWRCQKEVAKPQPLVSEAQMEDIIYDLTILEALKNNNPYFFEEKNIDPHTYVYKKYKIDSLQFVQNNRYYASNVKEYAKLYERVLLRIEQNKRENHSLLKKEAQQLAKPKLIDSIRKSKRERFEKPMID